MACAQTCDVHVSRMHYNLIKDIVHDDVSHIMMDQQLNPDTCNSTLNNSKLFQFPFRSFFINFTLDLMIFFAFVT